MDKAAVLVDDGYIRAIKRKYYPGKSIDYLKLSDALCEGYTRFRTYFYTCMPYQSNPPTERENTLYSSMDSFLSHLRGLPRFEVRLGRLRRTGNGSYEQKGVDVLFAIDLVQLCVGKYVNKVFLITGDSDMVPAVRIAKDAMAIMALVYHPSEYSRHLYDICDERIPLSRAFIDKVCL